MYNSAFDLTRKLNLAWQTSEKVEDVALAVRRSSCANLDIAMTELEQSLKAAVPRWMALVVLLAVVAVLVVVDVLVLLVAIVVVASVVLIGPFVELVVVFVLVLVVEANVADATVVNDVDSDSGAGSGV